MGILFFAKQRFPHVHKHYIARAMPLLYNQTMNEKQIAQLEATLEQLVEGAFTNLFRKRVSAHDIAMKLARSMENALRYSQDDVRPLAPDNYAIYLHPDMQIQLERNRPNIANALEQHIVELVSQLGYRLSMNPIVRLLGDAKLDAGEVDVVASHSQDAGGGTQAMQPIPIEAKENKPQKPQLIINGERTIELLDPVLNIGRSDDNHIVLDDSTCSRHHIQLRLRFGVYHLFDVNSRSGTYVNNVRITEHRLQTGDVISIGNTRLIYVTEDSQGGASPGTTQILKPVD
jgi:Protein of unknown function (DUF3662)/FHA domain